jgi:NAD(P)-dependent dehydrogenase (short-subunit alcohol dehydrogenase family)
MAVSYDLSGRIALVTGGAGGIGRAVVEQLGRAGAEVWVWDLAGDRPDGPRSQVVDVTNIDVVAKGIAGIIETSGRIDIVVNCVGYLGPYGPFLKSVPDDWGRILEANLRGVLTVCHEVVPYMLQNGTGRIVNLGSLAGKHGLPDLAVYSGASAGVIAFTKALGRELADTSIRVNAVAPGPIATELIHRLGSAVEASMIDSSPVRRLGTVDEVAAVILWLCSDAPSFTTGAVFDVSGGRAAY